MKYLATDMLIYKQDSLF